ncbi:MAG: hypothetical protein JWP20_680 [Roseomonas sp.]|nr:hypothetical protein [Roseomonas sp.]
MVLWCRVRRNGRPGKGRPGARRPTQGKPVADGRPGWLLSSAPMTDTSPPRRVAPESGPHLWSAEALSPADWMIPLGAEAAAEMAAGLASPGMPLARLDPLLSRVVERLAHGQGFVLLRGLPAPDDTAALLGLLGSRIGRPVLPPPDPGAPFLTAPADIVLLVCEEAKTVVLRSAAAVHNAMMKANRAALEVLYRPLPHGEDLDLPVFAVSSGVFSARLDRAAIGRATPPEALAALDAALDTPGLALTLPLRPGDVLCLNPFLVWASGAAGLAMLPLVSAGDSRLADGAFAGLAPGASA